ncbi:hypothetical protein HBHAL_4349 [Halobacillus halophilus DSM 2266]|uniref:Uncharacterized protein n=1 Tax=Halobacillus halophilus (strain ATCC 35676 / DSM 2266 / JCM 20832 / KCTC 3685 / LMG 17431 / NBRC 102448 / NCIMB 2269) TaxID=866895 RepID=I0JRC0_HALH3|nr:hypothetical protein HBHAL_4349 [Halobacillus halophilus DSM 2266]
MNNRGELEIKIEILRKQLYEAYVDNAEYDDLLKIS